nr:MAG TPA: hypothetical protein [Caudoviricetes sp.]DAG22507.1 MAG TPA: hypothetical protein [Caudoviricetes sp.]
MYFNIMIVGDFFSYNPTFLQNYLDNTLRVYTHR